MFRSLWMRKWCALAALSLLLSAASAMAQNRARNSARSDIGFIEAPSPAALDVPTDAQHIGKSPESAKPETLDLDDAQLDYTFDESATGEPQVENGCNCGCGNCENGCGQCGCGKCGHGGCGRHGHCGCHGGCELFGCLRRMMATCGEHKQARADGCHDTCLDRPMDFEEGRRHDPNHTPAASGQLFQQYYTQGNANAIPAQMYVAPYPVPAAVGHTYITYQAFEPHQFLYRHKREYIRYHGPSGGLTKTRVYWW